MGIWARVSLATAVLFGQQGRAVQLGYDLVGRFRAAGAWGNCAQVPARKRSVFSNTAERWAFHPAILCVALFRNAFSLRAILSDAAGRDGGFAPTRILRFRRRTDQATHPARGAGLR